MYLILYNYVFYIYIYTIIWTKSKKKNDNMIARLVNTDTTDKEKRLFYQLINYLFLSN